MNPYHFENMKNSISFSFFKKKIARLMTGTKVGTVEEDEVTVNATMVRFYFQFHVKKRIYIFMKY